MEKYRVYVDDNFHFGDTTERYHLGDYETRDEAIKACKAKVDEYFERIEKGRFGYTELWDGYKLYGEDPFIINDDSLKKFSAWEYAKQRCQEFAR